MIKAFYFAPKNNALRYGDNRTVAVGETHVVPDHVVKVCKGGLHASTRIVDAIKHAPGYMLYDVIVSGNIDHSFYWDKLAGSKREYIKCIDFRPIMMELVTDSIKLVLDEDFLTLLGDKHRELILAVTSGKFTEKSLLCYNHRFRSMFSRLDDINDDYAGHNYNKKQENAYKHAYYNRRELYDILYTLQFISVGNIPNAMIDYLDLVTVNRYHRDMTELEEMTHNIEIKLREILTSKGWDLSNRSVY